MFVMVNTDNPNLKIPAFVDRVPLVYSRSNNRIIVEDDIVNFIETLMPAQTTCNNEGGMLSMADISKGISDRFSFIGDGDEAVGEVGKLEPKSFVFIGNENTPRGGGTQQGNTGGTGTGDKPPKFDSKIFDNYMMQRDNDMSRLFPGKQNGSRLVSKGV
jgi:hypothetical protein